jgi:hypothetical protein
MNIPLGEVVHFDVTTRNIATGVGCDADAAPTFSVFEEDTDTAIVTGTMTKRTALTGNYRGTFTASTANGFEVGKFYIIVVAGTVGGIVDKEVISSFRVSLTEVVVGSAPVDLATWLGTAPLVLEDQQVQAVVPATQQTYLAGVLKTAIPAESMEGRDAAALGKLLDVATPVLTAASVNQTIDNPTAASIAALILATPANKLATDASGYVTYANAAPPAASAISTQVASDLASAHGAGSWATATGFALASVWTETIAGRLDVATSTRLATTGYTAPDNTSIAAVKVVTDKFAFTGNDVKTTLDGEEVTPTAVSKTGYKLAADGLDSITADEPTAKPTTFRGWLMWLVQRFRRASKSPTAIVVKTEAGVTVTSQAVTDNGIGTETLGPPT